MGIHGPLVCAVQSLSPALLQVLLVLILRCSASSNAEKLLTLWLPGEIALPSGLLAPMNNSVHWAASRECCLWHVWLCARAWFWLSGNAKIIKCNTCDSRKGLREGRRAQSKRGHPRWKTDGKWHAKCDRERELTMVRLQEERARSKPAFVEEQLQPGAMSSGVKEWEGNKKGPERTCGWSGEFWYRHLLLDLILSWFAKTFGTNFNGHGVY